MKNQLTNELLSMGFRSAPKVKIVKEIEKKVTERSVHNAVCKYLKLQYPKVLFLSDFGAGLLMSQGNAQLQNKQKSDHSFPDLMIFEPRGNYHGLFIEIKKDKVPNTEHTRNQQLCIDLLIKRGYYAKFGCGFDDCKNIIDNYLHLGLNKT